MSNPKKNPAAVALGRLGGAATKGKPKNYSAEEIQRRTNRIQKVNAMKKQASKICGCALEDCPVDGSLLERLRWVRANNMGRGTDGEIDATKLDALIAKLAR